MCTLGKFACDLNESSSINRDTWLPMPDLARGGIPRDKKKNEENSASHWHRNAKSFYVTCLPINSTDYPFCPFANSAAHLAISKFSSLVSDRSTAGHTLTDAVQSSQAINIVCHTLYKLLFGCGYNTHRVLPSS